MNVSAYLSTVVSTWTEQVYFLVILYLLRFNSSSWKVNFMASDRFRPPINQITEDRSEIYLASFETRKFQEWATFPAGRSVTADLNRFVDLNPSDNISQRTHTQIKKREKWFSRDYPLLSHAQLCERATGDTDQFNLLLPVRWNKNQERRKKKKKTTK